MNRQEVFNTVYKKLVAQGKRCANDHGNCFYERDGMHCAVGHLLPEGHPGMSFQGSVYGLLHNHPDLKETLGIETDTDMDFLSSLQRAHDEWSPSRPLKDNMLYVASDYGLNTEVLS